MDFSWPKSYVPREAERLAVKAMLRPPDGTIRAALLEGPPGCGKTAMAAAVAEGLGAEQVYHLLHSWSDDQELCCGIDVAAAVEGDGARVRQLGVLAVAAQQSRHRMTVLCLDEIDKVQERTENLLLDFLQSGRVPVRPGVHLQALSDHLLVFLTSNGQRALSDALIRRVRRVRMAPLPVETAVALAAERAKVPVGVVRCLAKAAMKIAAADGAQLSVQELGNLAADVWHCATSAADLRELLAQWAARGEAGAAMAARGAVDEVATSLGELRAQRRKE